ncbi:TerD family protein [Gordonia humi]|uniref:TerD family protein n=1 Tax=Gordonia humi TaxID=686429 RepID=UPI0036199A91
MELLVKGAKAPLVSTRARVSASGGAQGSLDLIAVLLTESGVVRSDSDMVFFNNPVADGVRLDPDGAFSVDVDAVPPGIDRIVVAASTEAQGITFGQVGAVAVTIRSESDDLEFRPPDLSSETVLILVEFYRRAGAWKIDAVGQGYAAGLAAFATERGISVDDDAPQQAAPTPPAPTAPAPTPPAPTAPRDRHAEGDGLDHQGLAVEDGQDRSPQIAGRSVVGAHGGSRMGRARREVRPERAGEEVRQGRPRRLLLLPERGDERVRRALRRTRAHR